MKILISGASGLVGTTLSALLKAGGHDVYALVRRAARKATEISWYPDDGSIDSDKLEGFDAVIHLAGESIAGRRWNEAFKQTVLTSRINSTRLLATALCRLKSPPAVLISASAIGIYGDRGQNVLTEQDPPGEGFLTEVCKAWESESEPVKACGIRLVNPRIGIVLSRQGGALAKMLPPFELGLGGVMGPGSQIMSWIAIDDLARAFQHCLETDSLSGPVNFTAPQPASNREFTRSLGKVLNRPTLMQVPEFALKLGLGPEMAQALLLDSTDVRPAQLLQSGFEFQYPELEPALKHVLGR